jgi:hypothetical protein
VFNGQAHSFVLGWTQWQAAQPKGADLMNADNEIDRGFNIIADCSLS